MKYKLQLDIFNSDNAFPDTILNLNIGSNSIRKTNGNIELDENCKDLFYIF